MIQPLSLFVLCDYHDRELYSFYLFPSVVLESKSVSASWNEARGREKRAHTLDYQAAMRYDVVDGIILILHTALDDDQE